MSMKASIRRFIPATQWLEIYDKQMFSSDFIAAMIVTVMLIPQSLAYALLAGLPAQVGLYASMLPLIAYAIFGSSRTLAVGPVAVVSLMTAAAVGGLALQDPAQYLLAAVSLALLSGLILLAMGALKLGAMANFLSHPVISGFISASAIIIALSQFKHILGVGSEGHNVVQISMSLIDNVSEVNYITLAMGCVALCLLFVLRRFFKQGLLALAIPEKLSDILAKSGPALVVIATTVAVWGLELENQGVAVVGNIAAGLPNISLPTFDYDIWQQLFISALLISVVGFVESVSVAQTLAAKRRQRIDPNRELIGLGASNIASSISGGFPVTGGFSRSVVNFDAGAQTPAAGIMTAVGIALVTLYLTPLIYFLPKATLAATIIIAVLSLVDLRIFKRIWRYSRADFSAMCTTFVLTLFLGVELGIICGVLLSIALHLQRTSQPHSAIVGQVANSEHFRNVERHDVQTDSRLLSLRVDESLYFANARYLEDRIYSLVATHPSLEHVVLMCPAVNHIDASALESLEAINERLRDSAVQFHLSEVKGPVMDRLHRSSFIEQLSGDVFLSQYAAWQALSGRGEGK